MVAAGDQFTGSKSDASHENLAGIKGRWSRIAARRGLLLPDSTNSARVFKKQAKEIRAAAGSVYILHFQVDSADEADLIALFDRTADYQEFIARLEEWRRKLPKLSAMEARKTLATITRGASATAATDLFPGKPQKQMQNVLAEAEASFNARFSMDEPRPAHRKIPHRQTKDFKGKTWATRERMWIDRVCSAWLILRFIDARAKLVWLKHTKDKPKRALGFDFDGAEFTHVDSKVTFEVLLASFGLDNDIALARLGSLVHFLDVGGIPVAPASSPSDASRERPRHLSLVALLEAEDCPPPT